jgi:hypothetical protein
MNKTRIAKTATSLIVGAGVHHVTDGIINSNVDFGGLNSFGKFTVAAARVVVSSMAASKTREYTDGQIDQLIEAWNTARPTTEDTTESA